MKRTAVIAALVGAAEVAILIAFAPYVFADVYMAAARLNLPVTPAPANPGAYSERPGPWAGTLVDGYWLVQKIAPDTWAIGEPKTDQDNYEYLLTGRTRALLIDAGETRTHDINRVIRRLTAFPVTVAPTHLHWDHTNGLRFFRSIALIDLPETRLRERNGVVRLSRYEYMAPSPPRFRVTEWIRPGGSIDLGGRRIEVLSTPGHTATSTSFYDGAAHRLFTGDFIYPTSLYEFMADSSLSAWSGTADQLLSTLPADTRLYGAHCCRSDVPRQAPWLGVGDLRDARTAVADVRAGHARGRGVIIRRFPVNARMTMLTLYPFGNW